MPGPSAFIGNVEEMLRETRSVVAYVSPCFDFRWCESLRGRLEGIFAWRDVHPDPSRFYQEASTRKDGLPFVGTLEMIESGLHSQLFVLTSPARDSWSSWTKLLSDFSNVQRSVDSFLRSVFLIVIDKSDLEAPIEAILTQCSIHDFLREEDAFFHACRHLDGGSPRTIETDIKTHVCSELALWDFDLCDYLMGLNLSSLLQPEGALRSYGEQKQAAADSLPERPWRQIFPAGHCAEGSQREHSVALAMGGNTLELRRRVWRGQVQVLFPLIEEQRLLLIRRIRDRCPAVLRQLAANIEATEIGPLHHAMVQERGCPRDLLRIAGCLKALRNKIAHLEVCMPNELPRSEMLLS